MSVRSHHTRARVRRLLAACTAAMLLAAALAALFAQSDARAVTLAEKRAQAAKIARQVAQLENEYDHLQERYRGAQYRLKDLDSSIDKATASLERTRKELTVAEARLMERVVTVYKDGDAGNELVALARAGSFDAFLDRMETIQRVSQQDRDIVVDIRDLRRKVVLKKRQLKKARAEQSQVVRQARRDKRTMGKKLSKRQQVLASVNGEIRRMVDAERARQAARERAAARASGENVTVRQDDGAGAAGAGSSTDVGSAISGGGAPPPPASGSAAAAASVAMGQVGVPYKWGGATPSTGFDCSGLVMWAFAQVGVSLPHSSYALWNAGPKVSRDQLQTGDLVFFSGLGHVGIYVGGGNFVHAPHSGSFVRVDSLHSSYGVNSYVGAVRV